jgi:hypothetical protein
MSEEINIFEDSTYTIQFRDNLTSRGTSDFRIKGSELLKLMLPIEREQRDVDWDKLREKFFLDCVDTTYVNKYTPSLRKVNYAPHDLFEWFKDNLFKSKT